MWTYHIPQSHDVEESGRPARGSTGGGSFIDVLIGEQSRSLPHRVRQLSQLLDSLHWIHCRMRKEGQKVIAELDLTETQIDSNETREKIDLWARFLQEISKTDDIILASFPWSNGYKIREDRTEFPLNFLDYFLILKTIWSLLSFPSFLLSFFFFFFSLN